MAPTTPSYDVYDSYDVSLNNSPRLKALKPKLRPTPSPPPDIDEDDQGKPVPSQGDAVLISLLGNGRALETARAAATALLPLDDKASDKSEKEVGISSNIARTSHMDRRGLPKSSNMEAEKLASAWEPSVNLGKVSLQALLNPALDTDYKDAIPADPSRVSQSLPQPATTSPEYQVISILTNKHRRKLPTNKTTISLSIHPIPITPASIHGFPCTYPGCSAKPFATTYLLTSHKNIHSAERPYYCPRRGCSRNADGKGFKRKNEMIRHELGHEPQEYACPYCHVKRVYPRPDNLQRLVFISSLCI